MEWVLVLLLASGPVTMAIPYASEEECLGAGELALPSCSVGIGIFRDVEEVCHRRAYICAPQPRRIVRAPIPKAKITGPARRDVCCGGGQVHPGNP
jgi:hypothetical protein